jgi:tol-pal system protein YbgF
MLLAMPLKALLVPTIFGLSIGSGCAHQQAADKPQVQVQQQETIAQLQSRLEEVERTNGRLNVRIEELEDQLFLLQDMTESNRIALQRRGYMQRGTYINRNARAQAPQPAPESYYGAGNPYGAQQAQPQANQRPAPTPKRRKVTRIPLSRQQSGAYGTQQAQPRQAQPQQAPAESAPVAQADAGAEEEEVVITEDEYRKFFGEPPARKSKKSSSSSSRSSGKRAQPPVTDEKLATSDEKADEAKPREKAQPTRKSGVKPLDLYKTALADYRGGNYADALEGFRAFLQAGPNSNYLDNALYWVGECHYGLGEYEKATSYFQRVLREQPDGNKVPDAMLKMSLAYERLGKPDQTRALLEKLTNRYPTTNAGRLGAQKLSELGN